MLALLLAILIIAALFGGGFALGWLWIIAAVLLVAWLLGFIVRAGEGARWYYW